MPIPLIQSFERGPRGSGIIIDNGDTYLVKSDTGQTYLIAKTAVGNYVQKVVTNVKVAWSLNQDMTELWGVSPWSGVYLAKYDGMVLSEGQSEPEPKLKEGGPRQNKRGGTYIAKDRYVFTVRWGILSPPFDGVDTVKQYTYSFFLDKGTVIIRGGEDAKRLWQLMESHGIDMENESIPVVENVLPWLDKRIRELDRAVQLKFEEGWVNDVTPTPIGMTIPNTPTNPTPVQNQPQENLPKVVTPDQLAALMAQLGITVDTGEKRKSMSSNQEVAKVVRTERGKPNIDVQGAPTAPESGVPLPGLTLNFTEKDEE